MPAPVDRTTSSTRQEHLDDHILILHPFFNDWEGYLPENFVTSDALTAALAALPSSYTTTFGNGVDEVFSISHGLGTEDVLVSARLTDGTGVVELEWEPIDEDTILITLAAPITNGEYTVRIFG